MEYTCSNFNLRLVKSATATDSLIDIGDKMLGEPDLVQVHSTELVSFARSEFQQAFHYGGIGHELTVSRYYGPYSDYSGSEVNALLQAELNASKAKYGTLTVDVDGVSGGSFQMLNAALNDIVVLQGPQYGKGFAIEYRYSFGDMVDISTTKLLDRFAGAAGAYSLRELSAAWAGLDVVEVREDSGDTLQAFTAAELTDGTLATFCGANNGYVKTWYDQSGNANNATQATLVDQPKIYDSATGLITEDGLPALLFSEPADGMDLAVDILTDGGLTPPTITAVAKVEGDTGWQYLVGSRSGTQIRALRCQGTPVEWKDPVSAASNDYHDEGNLSLNGQLITSPQPATVNNIIFADGSNNWDTNNIGAIGGTTYGSGVRNWNGTIQEVVVWTTNQLENRTEVELNMNRYFQLY